MQSGPIIDMTPDGQFRRPPTPRRGGRLSDRILVWAIIIGLVAGAGAIAALFAWLLFMLIPVVLVAGVVAYLAFRFQVWRARASLGRQRDLFRP